MNSMQNVLGTTARIVKQWRKQRELSQAQLAAKINISTRHLSFIECGRSIPSRAVLELLIEVLKIPKMQAEQLLVVSGYSAVQQTHKRNKEYKKDRGPDWFLDFMLSRFNPYTAFVHDEHMNYICGNQSFEIIMESLPFTPYLFDGKTNALLTVAHPLGLRPYIKNWGPFFQQMFWRFENRAKNSPGDNSYQRIIKELEKIPGIPELLNSKVPEEVLHGIGEIKLEFCETQLQFARVTTESQGTMINGHSRHYQIVAFLPGNQKTANICKHKFAYIFENAERLKEVAQIIKIRKCA